MRSLAVNHKQGASSIWRFGGQTFQELVLDVLHGAQENGLFERASGLAFDFLLALFPLLFILLTAFGLFASDSVAMRTNLQAYFADFLPGLAFQLVHQIIEEIATMHRNTEKLVVGIVLSIWFSSEGVAAIISALNSAFRVKETRSWFKVRGIAVFLTLVILILSFSALCIVLLGADVVDWIGNEIKLGSATILFWKGLQWPTAILFVITADALIYAFGPNIREKRWRWLTPGSAFAAGLWLAASLEFRIYLRYVNNYTVIFGSLGAFVILLIWLYVTGLAFLIGGEINASIERAVARNIEI